MKITVGDLAGWPGAPKPKPEPAISINGVTQDPSHWDTSRPTCEKTGKIRYPNRRAAEAHQHSLAARNPEAVLSVYICKSCYSWHVGRT